MFASAPYIGFLATVAALSVGLPFIIGYAVFSVVTIALSYKEISKNKTISEKEAQLADEKSKVEAKGKIISEKEAVVQDQKQTISKKDAEISSLQTQLARKEKRQEEVSDPVALSNLFDGNSEKEENGQGWFAWSLGKAKSAMTEVVVIGVDVTKPYLAKITKALAPNLNM